MPRFRPGALPAETSRASLEGLSASAAFRLSRFSKQYRHRLFRGLRDLEEYLSQRRDGSLSSLLSDTGRAEEHLAQYVLCRHEQTEGASLLIVKHALLCCQHVQPRLKGRIQTAWENLRVWEEQRVCRLRPPLPVPLWLFLVGLARAHSVVETVAAISHRWKVLATFIEVGLLAMLRPGELLKLRHADISLPGEFTFSQPFAALRIASPKNRRQFGVEQFVVLRNPCTIQRLRELLIENSTSFLWTDSQAKFSQMFKQLCNELHLSDCRFTPASLRPGSGTLATLYYGMGIPISTLRFMGRWTVEKSLEHYIQLAMSSQIMNRLAPLVTCRLKKVGPMHVVAGGAFKGACFEDLSHDQLVKASKRYPGDPRLQKYAKAVVASAELDEGEPEPCLPIAIRNSAKESFRSKCCGFACSRALGHMSLRRSVVILFLVMAVILTVRPSLATACTKLLVRVMRVAIRRTCGFFLLIFEGLLDELIYQIEFSVRQALPHNLDWEQAKRTTHVPPAQEPELPPPMKLWVKDREAGKVIGRGGETEQQDAALQLILEEVTWAKGEDGMLKGPRAGQGRAGCWCIPGPHSAGPDVVAAPKHSKTLHDYGDITVCAEINF
eukprot:Skav218990  [mRNA]  locus=scaffold169:151238:155473:+ [translate_table: standard]